MNPKISIIVPIYGVFHVLKECVDSIINQTLKDIEIILVNDASPHLQDDEICKEYASKDNRVVYIKHDKNTRQGGARNSGFLKARGEYIWFVDGDDFVNPYSCEFLYNTLIKYNLEAVGFMMTCFEAENRFFVGEDSNCLDSKIAFKIMSGNDLLEDTTKILSLGPCSFMYKKSVLKYQFAENVFQEDVDWVYINLSNIERLMYTNHQAYYYRKGQKSTSNSGDFFNYIYNSLLIVERMCNYIQTNKLDQENNLYRALMASSRYADIKFVEHYYSVEDKAQKQKIDDLKKAVYEKYNSILTKEIIKIHSSFTQYQRDEKWIEFGRLSKWGKLERLTLFPIRKLLRRIKFNI